MDFTSYHEEGIYEAIPNNEVKRNDDFSSYSAIELYLQEIRKYPILSIEKERELGKRVAEGDEAAKEKFINSGLSLVVYVAKNYCNNKNELLDLIQEGNLGLIRAVETFDYTKGYRFSTYSTMVIRNAILDFLKKKRYCDEISLNTPFFDSEMELEDLESNPEEILFRNYDRECREWIISNIELLISTSKLTEKEETVFRLRYDFYKKKKKPQEEVANELGSSRSNVRKIEQRAVSKIINTAREMFGIENFV